MTIDLLKLHIVSRHLHPSVFGPGALFKRVMDILGALVGLVLFAPLLVLVAIAIRLESPGPVLFRQKRVGLNGEVFTMYKFRSMRVDAELALASISHLNEVKDGPIFKLKEDPRVTRVGRFIRKTSLDELPQFFNALIGNMSLVGPRPPLPREVLRYEEKEWQRLSVKPGLSGLWQVNGRSALGSFQQMYQLDLHYIKEWSLWLDLKIILKTFWVMLDGTGSY